MIGSTRQVIVIRFNQMRDLNFKFYVRLIDKREYNDINFNDKMDGGSYTA